MGKDFWIGYCVGISVMIIFHMLYFYVIPYWR